MRGNASMSHFFPVTCHSCHDCFFLLFLFLLSSPSSFLLLLCLEIGVSVYLTGWLQTCYVVQAGSKFQVPLLLFPKCCDYRHVPSHPVLILQTSNMYICAFPDMKYMSFYYASSPAPMGNHQLISSNINCNSGH